MEFKTLLVIRCILITELLKPGGGCVLKLMICVTIIPILYMTGKDIEYLSQYLNLCFVSFISAGKFLAIISSTVASVPFSLFSSEAQSIKC